MKKGIMLAFVVMTISITSCLYGQSSQERASIKSSIEAYLEQAEKNGFNGSVLVDFQGQRLLAEGYGHADKKLNIKNTPKTVFSTGSVTKQFTGAAVLKLEMQGKLSVRDKITKYFDNVPDNRRDMTIHELLTHSAGFPGAIGDDYDAISEEDFVRDAFESDLKFPDVSKYNYSNVGYSLLALIIERVSGMTYEAYLNKYLFTPAGMMNTGYVMPKWKAQDVAIGYRGVDKKWGKPNEKKWSSDGPYLNLKGNGGILSTVEDLYLWHKALLSDAILNKEAKEKYYGKHVEEGEGSGSYYGYGWAIFPTSRNTDLIAHNGGNGIFFTDFWRYLEEKVTIILMTNNAKQESDLMASKIGRIIRNPEIDISNLFSKAKAEIPVEELEVFAMKVYRSLVEGGEKEWEVFLTDMCSEEFRNIAPMDKHFNIIGKFKERRQGAKVDKIEVQENEVFLTLTMDGEQSQFMISIDLDESGKMVVAGLRNE